MHGQRSTRDHEPLASGTDLESALRVGGLLRDRRQSLGLSRESVGRAIRVGMRQIVAIEEGRFEDLPPQPYARGLVSAYAMLVGFEPEEILRSCGPALCGSRGRKWAHLFYYPARERFTWREWTVPFTLAVAVVSFVIARAVLTPAPVELMEPATMPRALQRPIQQAAVPAQIPESPAVEGAAATPAAPPGVRVLLRCEGSTWAEAAADGEAPRRYELGPGQNLEVTARERLSLALGDAGVIRIRVDERELGFIGYKGEMKAGLSFTAAKPPVAGASVAADGD